MGQQTHWALRQSWHIEDDVLFSRWVGAATLEELEPFLAFAERCAAQTDPLFLIVDNTHAEPGRPEVRRRLVDWARRNGDLAGVAIFGGDFATRAIGMLIINAIALVTQRRPQIVFLSDEAAARSWVDQRRTLLRAGRK